MSRAMVSAYRGMSGVTWSRPARAADSISCTESRTLTISAASNLERNASFMARDTRTCPLPPSVMNVQ